MEMGILYKFGFGFRSGLVWIGQVWIGLDWFGLERADFRFVCFLDGYVVDRCVRWGRGRGVGEVIS